MAVDGLDQVLAGLLALPDRVTAAAVQAGEQLAPSATAELRANHPWQTQTGAAEAGLKVSAGVDADGPALVFAGGTEGQAEAYSDILQTTQGGRFANLYPTCVGWAPRWVQATAEVFGA